MYWDEERSVEIIKRLGVGKGLSEGMGVAVANILESTATITLVTTTMVADRVWWIAMEWKNGGAMM